MIRSRLLPSIVTTLATVALCAPAVHAREAAESRWESAIQAFEEADRESFPVQNGILFIGSSSIRGWRTLAEDFPGHDVINRGFGGSRIADSTRFIDRIVVPYFPKVIVLYAGENDLTGGLTPEEVRADFQEFVRETRAFLPDTRIAFISMKPSPRRWHLAEAKKTGNTLIRDFIQKDPLLSYIDVFDAMLGADGQPRPDIFVDDNLHLNAAGYKIWTKIVGEHLRKIGAPPKRDPCCP